MFFFWNFYLSCSRWGLENKQCGKKISVNDFHNLLLMEIMDMSLSSRGSLWLLQFSFWVEKKKLFLVSFRFCTPSCFFYLMLKQSPPDVCIIDLILNTFNYCIYYEITLIQPLFVYFFLLRERSKRRTSKCLNCYDFLWLVVA